MSKTVERSNMTQTDAKGHVLREPKGDASSDVNFKWWALDEKDMAAAIAGTMKFMQLHQGNRIDQLKVSTRLYGSTSLYNLIGSNMGRGASVNTNPANQRVSFNICSSIIDTLESKMAKNKVIPTYITNGGDWSAQKKAKDLTKFTQGLFYEQKVHKKAVHCWGDAAVWGDGFVQVYEKDKRVVIDRVLPHELFVDTMECLTGGQPHQLHRHKYMDRDIALELLPELEEYIMTVSPANYQDIGGQGTAVDIIPVTESWHLKSGEGANDGLHVFSVGEGAFAEDYEKDYFPFPHLRYAKQKLGWYGQGACERLQNIQSEINRCMILKQRSLWMQGSFKVLIENGSKIVSQHLSNEIGVIIHYTGKPPQYVTPPATNPELQQWIDALITYGYQQEGMSRLSAAGEVPMGVESGKAMRVHTQITDDRFLFMQQELEEFCLEIGRQAVNVVKEIYSRTKKYDVIFPDTRFMETVNWGDIKLDDEQYVLKAYPTSSLSEDLTGRLSEVQEMAQAGMVSPRAARRLMSMPDVEIADSLANAAEDRLHQIFENMLEHKEGTRFQPGFHDAQLGAQLAMMYVNYAEYYKCPSENVQLVRDFLAMINAEALAPKPGVVAPEAVPQPAMDAQMMAAARTAPPQTSGIPADALVPQGTLQ